VRRLTDRVGVVDALLGTGGMCRFGSGAFHEQARNDVQQMLKWESER
jgi:hypothetical protein